MNKWEELKLLIDAELSWKVHYSLEKPIEHNSMYRVKKWMDDLEKREKFLIEETNAFLYTDVPEFDKKSWERILEEKRLKELA